MKVLKFGGTSVGAPEKILQVKQIVENQNEDIIVVVSAFGGVTNDLVRTSRLAASDDLSYTEELNKIKRRHLDAVDQLIEAQDRTRVSANVKLLLNELENFLHGVYLIKELTPKTSDYILSFGERLSASIIAEVVTNAYYADARDFIKTDSNFGNAKVDFEISTQLTRDKLKQISKMPIVPGFISSNDKGQTTTLGRGGSDYTAAIIASILEVSVLEIWTDVDGFMTADPRKVKKAFPIDCLSYAEAMELSHFGAKVIYTPTVQPAYIKGIPIVIKNTLNPTAKGTIIKEYEHERDENIIKGISSMDHITLITIHGPGMVGVRGISRRIFGALADNGVNIILISQASSEYSISLAVNPDDTKKAQEALLTELNTEIEYKNIIQLKVEENLSIIAIVGENMKNTPGISGCLFNSLGKNGINVIAIAQGSSELNISAVINNNSLKKALNVIHENFFLSDYIELHLYQVGTDTVGGMLLQQLNQQQEYLMKEHRLKINVVGLADVNHFYFNEEGIDLDNYKELLDNSQDTSDMQIFVQRMKDINLRNSVFIDCTASPNVTQLYESILNSYISVVAANKIACSSSYELYSKLKATAKKRGVKFLYETNVGAGLPVIKTLDDLMKSGDKVIKLEAVLSGTLNFIFDVLSADISMSKAIRLAKEHGYTEPDPRIDLSGTDVMRKLLILSRESGYKLESSDIDLQPFLPESCLKSKSMEEFWVEVEKTDADFETRRKALEAQNKRWTFIAKLEDGKASIRLHEVDIHHPFANLKGTDNIILINSSRYREQALTIKGPGAGAAVTATGIFADIISIANI